MTVDNSTNHRGCLFFQISPSDRQTLPGWSASTSLTTHRLFEFYTHLYIVAQHSLVGILFLSFSFPFPSFLLSSFLLSSLTHPLTLNPAMQLSPATAAGGLDLATPQSCGAMHRALPQTLPGAERILLDAVPQQMLRFCADHLTLPPTRGQDRLLLALVADLQRAARRLHCTAPVILRWLMLRPLQRHPRRGQYRPQSPLQYNLRCTRQTASQSRLDKRPAKLVCILR